MTAGFVSLLGYSSSVLNVQVLAIMLFDNWLGCYETSTRDKTALTQSLDHEAYLSPDAKHAFPG